MLRRGSIEERYTRTPDKVKVIDVDDTCYLLLALSEDPHIGVTPIVSRILQPLGTLTL